jgi:cobaltochelatase CobS
MSTPAVKLEAQESAKEQEPGSSSKRIRIEGIRLQRKETNFPSLVPQVDPNYKWHAWTREAIQDIIDSEAVILDKLDKKSVCHAVMFIGDAGCGKTSWPEQIAARINQPVMKVNFNGQMTPSELLGYKTASNGSIEWVDGVLPFCMRHGIWIILDEFCYGNNDLRSPLHGVLSPGAMLMLLENGHEIVKPHPDFRVFATSNAVGCRASKRSIYPGENILNAATLSRFHVYEVNYLPPDEEAAVLMGSNGSLKEETAKQMVKVANMVRDGLEKDEIECIFSMRELLAWGNRIARGREPLEAARYALAPKISKEAWQRVEGIIQRVVGGK